MIGVYPNLLGLLSMKGLSGEQMGEMLGISHTAFHNKIKGKSFTVEEAKALCKYFGKPIEYLFATEDEIK